VDPKIFEFDQELKNYSFQNELLFKKLKKDEQEKLESEFINRAGGTIMVNKKNKNIKIIDTKTSTMMITKDLLELGKNIEEIARERNLTYGTILKHIEDIIKKYPKTKIKQIRPQKKIVDSIKKANNKLKDEEIGKLSPLKTILDKDGLNISFNEIRIAKLFI
jgi:hypothetical protein